MMVERQIQDALNEGKFDNLPGFGRRLILDDDSQVPESLKMSYRILKMSGHLPPELELRNEVLSLHQLLIHATEADVRITYQRKLDYLKQKLHHLGVSTRFLDCLDYGDAVSEKLIK